MSKSQTFYSYSNIYAFLKILLLSLLPMIISINLAHANDNIRYINSINDLRTMTALYSDEVVSVKYYSILGDGGGGIFNWNATSTKADNDGTFIAVSGVATGRWQRTYTGAVNIKWFGAKGDGATDDSLAFINAWKAATYFNQIITGTRAASGLYLPSGTYVITQNYFLNNCGAQAGYSGCRYSIHGDGYGSSIIVFKPSANNAYIYDQTQSAAPTYVGLNVRNLQIIFDSSNNNGVIHGFKVYATAGYATQNFIFDSIKFTGRPDTIFLDLQGPVNADSTAFINSYFHTLKTLLRINNTEAVCHSIISTNIEGLYGNAVDVLQGGMVTMFGGSVIFNGDATNECALLRVGGSNFSEHSGNANVSYTFIGVRCEFRGPKSRSLFINDYNICVPIKFINCSFAKVDHNQSFALVAACQGATITYDGCILPEPSTGSKFEFTDSYNTYSYAQEGNIKSIVRFIGCMNAGSVNFSDPYADFSNLSFATSAQSVEYVGCNHIPDSIEYGQKYGTARSINPISGKLIPFSGYVFPYNDGTADAASFFRLYIPYNAFVESYRVTRGIYNGGSTTDYELQLVDKAEFDSPGSGIIYGTMPSQKFNLAIDWEVKINKRFSGTKDERTVYLRLKPGTITCNAPIKADIGIVYAKVF